METAKEIEIISAKILPRIKPNEEEVESITSHTNMIMNRLRQVVPEDVEILVVGSIARSTNLSGDSDIDIFMLFDKKNKREDIVKLGLQYAKKIVKKRNNERYEIRYAEHPYLRLYLNDYNIRADIVPAFKIIDISDKGTAVDRTPLHTEFINMHLSDKQRDDVRLLKYLLKVHDIYGAEVKTKGFSGYLCELLIYHYGSFSKLLENFSDIKLPLCINPLSKAKIDDNAVFKKFNSDFIVIDPVDPNRNVAAVVSKESLAKFVLIAREFLKRPSIKLFNRERFSENKANDILMQFLNSTGLKPLLLSVKVKDKSNDIIWPQLNKTANQIRDILEKFGFSIYLNLVWISGKHGLMLYLVPEQKLKTRLMRGPEITAKEPSNAFFNAHKKAYGIILNGLSVYALEKNRYETAKDALQNIIKNWKTNGSKDVKIGRESKLYTKIPRAYSYSAYVELLAKIRI